MEEKDKQLWKLAKKRVGFRRHAFTYLIVNAFLWALWFFTDWKEHMEAETDDDHWVPWPIWCTLGWGIGLAFHYYGVYMEDKDSAVEKEYQKLMDEKKRQGS